MTAYNVVRFRVKTGQEQEFLDAHRHLKRDFPGLRAGGLIKTGDRAYCFVGEWEDMASLAAARPAMIADLDRFRGTLEDLGHGERQRGLQDQVALVPGNFRIVPAQHEAAALLREERELVAKADRLEQSPDVVVALRPAGQNFEA